MKLLFSFVIVISTFRDVRATDKGTCSKTLSFQIIIVSAFLILSRRRGRIQMHIE